MPRRLAKILGWVLGMSGLVVLLFWMVLSSSVFSGFRRSLVETALSEEIGQSLVVRDDVRVRLGRFARLFVAGVEIPSETIDSINLAELNLLELEVDLVSLMQGNLTLDNLSVDGLSVNMTTLQDGTTSWTPAPDTAAKAGTSPESAASDGQYNGSGGSILDFLNDKTASFSEIGLKVDNMNTGFSFDFDLSSLLLEQLEDGQLVSLTSKGTVNGEAFSVDGNFPRGQSFTTAATFGELRLDFDGQPLSAEQGGGFSGVLTLDTGEIGEVLDILKLDRVLEGNGRLSADILRQGNVLKIGDLQTDVSLADGALFSLTGKVDNLLDATGFDMSVDARLHPKGQPPARAVDLKSLKLTGIKAHIISEGQSLKFEELTFLTNAFDQGLKQVGPVRIGEIRRTPEGKLSLLDISLQMGPPGAPYVVAKGELTDALQLSGLEIAGKLTGPASLVMRGFPKDKTGAFGNLSADFAVTDASGHFSLTKLDAYTEGTDLWSLKAHSAVPDVTSLQDLTFSLDLVVADGAAFLGALDLKPVDTGAVEFTASAKGQEDKFSTSASIAIDESRLSVALDTVVTDGNSVVRGTVNSALLKINDLVNGATSALAIASLSKKGGQQGKATGNTPTSGGDGKIEEPLVMSTGKERAKPDEVVDNKPEEPLVLGEVDAEETKPEAVTDNKPEEPLVLASADGKPANLVDPAGMLAKLDLEIAIEIAEITGQRGVSKVSSDLEIKGAKARFGPLDFSYGGGNFSLSAAMDLIENPDLLTVSGATSGWDLDEILKTAKVEIDARGKLRARFNVTGNRKSARAFINSAFGSATISMSNGAVASSLMELAGLGIFPWLFSAEPNQGYTNIVCAVAPLSIQAGEVSSNSIVVETQSVQMVIAGALDWRNDTISMRAEPRPVGRPLARSAWPFDVTGSLSRPNFKVQVGGSRAKRTGGARQSPAQRKPCTPDIRQLE